MAVFMQHQYLVVQNKSYKSLSRSLLLTSALIGTLTLSACQTTSSLPSNTATVTTKTPVTVAPTTTKTPPDTQNRPDGTNIYQTKPYIPSTDATPENNTYSENTSDANNPLTQQTQVIEQPEIIFNEPIYTPPRDDYMISQPPTAPSHNELLEQARQNSKQRSRQPTDNQSNLPAFRNLMQTGTSHLKSGNLTSAENSFTRAQRLAPRSSAVYFYLSQVALKKGQPRKAEAMARRGLTVSEDANRRRSLWQLILRSGQQQNNSRVVREAQQALK
ncbi:tetratricopeptide repeat protein [uncultured Psychrobacter sp.]|uniref:tetratricopeptide repeat protein n=1 Tax=uncultured Psychrobacter sp. TaxID=259303 RepID=UPI00263757FD|nr:tetratricopeptide repeat protein [uncultured Psychrobacter sp.]